MLRILDANLNRIGEGLRLLEEISRFILDDPDLSRELKSMRHNLLPKDRQFQDRLLASRRAGIDVGAFLNIPEEGRRPDVKSLVSANARRVEESLRVLEEISKVDNGIPGLDWEGIKRARFRIYELEQIIILKLTRRQRVERISGLYLVLDLEALRGRDEIEAARQAIRGGARVVQLRDKKRSVREQLQAAVVLRQVCEESGALFIVNDNLDIALASEAHGLHIGREDLPLPAARDLLPADRLLGYSTSTLEEAMDAEKAGADYIAVGSIYPSPSKAGTRITGLDTLRKVKERVSVPLVAIGGINEDNVPEVIRAGADASAVISAVLASDDIEGASRRIQAKFEVR
ncbi:MAG: thiamine phosphate synthase [Dehalococcoidia bacterium]|nr:thiamine phosphate synthase [Dehalococcoidia bacterium]